MRMSREPVAIGKRSRCNIGILVELYSNRRHTEMFLAHEFNDEEKQEAKFFKDFWNEISWGLMAYPNDCNTCSDSNWPICWRLTKRTPEWETAKNWTSACCRVPWWWNEDNNWIIIWATDINIILERKEKHLRKRDRDGRNRAAILWPSRQRCAWA